MAAEGDNNNDFYAVMGLNKECTPAELRNAYKKLAMKWHPDRCSAAGNPKYVEAAKKKFQAIQQAYSVLSDDNRRFLYDVGFYDCNDDDDENGMGEFLDEMLAMMSQNKSNGNRNESFEDMQELLEDIFRSDTEIFGSSSSSSRSTTPPSPTSLSSHDSCSSNKRNSSSISSGNFSIDTTQLGGFSIGIGGSSATSGEGSRRKQKISR